jgi:hypothetical protein
LQMIELGSPCKWTISFTKWEIGQMQSLLCSLESGGPLKTVDR